MLVREITLSTVSAGTGILMRCCQLRSKWTDPCLSMPCIQPVSFVKFSDCHLACHLVCGRSRDGNQKYCAVSSNQTDTLESHYYYYLLLLLLLLQLFLLLSLLTLISFLLLLLLLLLFLLAIMAQYHRLFCAPFIGGKTQSGTAAARM